MDGIQLRDELVRDRIRQAEEFLDPSECQRFEHQIYRDANMLKTMSELEVTVQTSLSCSIEVSED